MNKGEIAMIYFSKVFDSIQIYGAKYVNKKLGKSSEMFKHPYSHHHFMDYNSNLIDNLSKKHRLQLIKGNGNELQNSNNKPSSLHSILSSSALAVNAFSHIDKEKSSLILYNDIFKSVDFEKRLCTLKGRSATTKYANLDIFLEGKKTLLFIESKYSEPYKKKNSLIKESYKTKNNGYDYKLYDIDTWAPFIKSMEKKFSNLRFDLQQNLKHLIGIHNFVKENPEYQNYKIILLNLIYDVKESFGDKKLTDKLNQVISEFNEVKKPINDFMTSKPINLNFEIDYMTYSYFIENHLQDENVKDYLLYKYYNY